MTYGFRLRNDNNEIIVDSEFDHYHFAGKGVFIDSFVVPNIITGNITSHSYSGAQAISTGQVGGTIYRYSLDTRSMALDPIPLVFIRASDNDAGHILTKRTASGWELWVLSNNPLEQPGIYCFLPLEQMSVAAATPALGDNFGLTTFKEAGGRTYDSRIKPLKVIENITMPNPPSSARVTHTLNGYNPDFTPNRSNARGHTYSGNRDDLMYCCPSIGHCCQDFEHYASGEGFQSHGSNGYFYNWARGDMWWGFYRNTFRVRNADILTTYTPYAYGHVWKSEESRSGILTAVIAVIGAFFTFGASLALLAVTVTAAILTEAFTGSVAAEGLYYPYKNDSRNASETNPMILATWSQYD